MEVEKMGKTRILVALFCVGFSTFFLAAVEIYGSMGGFMLFRMGATLDCGGFYTSVGMGYIPRLSISMGEIYTVEIRTGFQVNHADLRNAILVPFTFDLSVEIRVITETYFYTTGGYNINVGIECLAEIFLFRNLHSNACGGVTVGVTFPIFSVTCYEEYFSFTFVDMSTPPYIVFVPEVGLVISF